MRFTRTRIVLLGVVALLALAYVSRLGVTMPERTNMNTARHATVAVFGATGTAGDGVLKAAIADPDVKKIYVITRRSSPRIDAAVATGRVVMKTHTNYLDYALLANMLKEVDAVYWALGTSALNVTKDEYGVIHVDYPAEFVKAWQAARPEGEKTFHYISGGGAGLDKSAHWAREKARAEQALFQLAASTPLRVVSFRPAYIAPAEERANILHNFAHAIFTPIKFAIRSTALGQGMLEVTARGLPTGTIIENAEILGYGAAYRERRGL